MQQNSAEALEEEQLQCEKHAGILNAGGIFGTPPDIIVAEHCRDWLDGKDDLRAREDRAPNPLPSSLLHR